MDLFEAAKGKWHIIYPEFGITNEVGTNKHSECPLCGKNKFRIDDKDGKGGYICTCSSGFGFTLLKQITGDDNASIMRKLKEILNISGDGVYRPKPNNTQKEALKQYREAEAIDNESEGLKYLNARGIYVKPRGGVKYHKAIFDHEYNKAMPALIAIASNPLSEACYRHVTYLDGNKKANVERQKKLLTLQKTTEPVAIKLCKHQTTLGIAEGIETALSAYQQFKCPTWAVLNTALMKQFKAPDGVTHLIIWADNDSNGSGLAAAFDCGRKNVLANNTVEKVTIKWTQNRGDFNDYLFEPSTINEIDLYK